MDIQALVPLRREMLSLLAGLLAATLPTHDHFIRLGPS